MSVPSNARILARIRSIACHGVTVLALLVAAVISAATVVSAASWHHPFYLAGHGYWHQRIPLVVHNETDATLAGRPVGIHVGPEAGELPITGVAAEAIRICSVTGVEMIFGMLDVQGKPVRSGPIPAHSTLIIPVECAAQDTAQYFVYFDNPSASEVPEYLSGHLGIQNSDIEEGGDTTPSHWNHDAGDPDHRAIWTKEDPHSGTRCLKTVVAPGAEPTWISSRQSDIHIVPGAKYVMRAWVKARNVRGQAGWYIHLGTRAQPMLISPMLYGGSGTYDWKEVVAEFTAPATADRADLGTVLRGTGTAWFDNVTLECQTTGKIRVSTGPREQMDLDQLGNVAPWYQEEDSPVWDRRAAVRLFNFEPHATSAQLVAVDCRSLMGACAADSTRQQFALPTTDRQASADCWAIRCSLKRVCRHTA